MIENWFTSFEYLIKNVVVIDISKENIYFENIIKIWTRCQENVL